MSTKAEQFIKSCKSMQNNIISFFTGNIYGGAFTTNIHGGAFLQKELAAKIHYFCKKAPPQTFDWVLNTALGDTVKKSIHVKGISQVMSNFFLFLYSVHAYFILLLKSEKRVTERNKRLSF